MIGYMGYMADEVVFLSALGIVAGAAVPLGAVVAIYRSRTRRLKVLEQALRSGNLSPQTEQLLVAELTKPGFFGRITGSRLLLVLGWLGIFVGISILATDQRGSEEVGIPFALMSFAVLTIPFALRELDHKRQAASRRP